MVWTGAGILVVIFGLLGVGTVAGIMALLGYDLSEKDSIFGPLGLIVGALYIYVFYNRVLAKREVAQELQDPKTGKTVVVKRSNSFMFIPFKYWPYVLAVIGVFTLIVGVDA